MGDVADYETDFIRDFHTNNKNRNMFYDATKIVEKQSERFSEISRLTGEVDLFKTTIEDKDKNAIKINPCYALRLIGERFTPSIRKCIIFDLMRNITDTYIITKTKLELANYMVEKYDEDDKFLFYYDDEYQNKMIIIDEESSTNESEIFQEIRFIDSVVKNVPEVKKRPYVILQKANNRFAKEMLLTIIFKILFGSYDTDTISEKLKLTGYLVDKYYEDNNFDFESDQEYKNMMLEFGDDLEKKLNKAISDKNSCRFATDL